MPRRTDHLDVHKEGLRMGCLLHGTVQTNLLAHSTVDVIRYLVSCPGLRKFNMCT